MWMIFALLYHLLSWIHTLLKLFLKFVLILGDDIFWWLFNRMNSLDIEFNVRLLLPCLEWKNINWEFKRNQVVSNHFHILLFCFVPSLSSCYEKATVALYFGRIRTRLGVVHFRVLRLLLWLLATEFAVCSKPPSRNNHRKAPYPRT